MSAVGWGSGSVGWRSSIPAGDIAYGSITVQQALEDLETNQATQAATIAAVQAGIVDVYTVHAQGAFAPFVVGAGAVVRLNIPTLVADDLFPPATWTVSGGIISYGGELAGLYEVHCPTSFSTNLAAATVYTLEVVEGTDLTAVPVRRSIASGAVEKQLTISDTTINPTGYLRLQETGGEIGLFIAHNSGVGATLDITSLSLVLQRSRLP